MPTPNWTPQGVAAACGNLKRTRVKKPRVRPPLQGYLFTMGLVPREKVPLKFMGTIGLRGRRLYKGRLLFTPAQPDKVDAEIFVRRLGEKTWAKYTFSTAKNGTFRACGEGDSLGWIGIGGRVGPSGWIFVTVDQGCALRGFVVSYQYVPEKTRCPPRPHVRLRPRRWRASPVA